MFCFAKQKLLITSDNSVYAVRAFPESPLPYLLRKHRIHANVIQNAASLRSRHFG